MYGLAALLCLVAAALTAAAGASGAPSVSTMPALPWGIGVLGCLLGAAVAVWPRGTAGSRHRRALAVLGLVAALVMVVSAVGRLPHDLLSVISWLLQRVTGADPLFEMTPAWLASGGEVARVAAAAAMVPVVLRDRRAGIGVCVGCGRENPEPPAPRPMVLRGLGAVAVLAPLPYAVIKVVWGLGGRIGLQDPGFFEGVTLLTPGFGDTVLLCGLGVVAAVAMAVPVRGTWARLPLGVVGVTGSAMLLPVGVLSGVGFTRMVLGLSEFTDGGIALWAFGLVYSGFLVWGLALAALTWTYLLATRRPCREHGYGAGRGGVRAAGAGPVR